MVAGAKSKLAIASPKSTSLRTTVPQGIVEQLDLEVGDTLDWDIQFLKGQKIVVVRKV